MSAKILLASNGKKLPVFDARTPMKLHVGADDIAAASRKQPNSCALAQACLKKSGVKEVRFHLSRAYIRTNELNWQRFLVNGHLRREIVALDRGGRFMPGDYELQRIPPSQRLTGKATGGTKGKTNKNRDRSRKRRAYNPTQDVRLGPA